MARYAPGERVALAARPDEELEIVTVIERPGRLFEYDLRHPDHRLIRAHETEIMPALSEAGFG